MLRAKKRIHEHEPITNAAVFFVIQQARHRGIAGGYEWPDISYEYLPSWNKPELGLRSPISGRHGLKTLVIARNALPKLRREQRFKKEILRVMRVVETSVTERV